MRVDEASFDVLLGKAKGISYADRSARSAVADGVTLGESNERPGSVAVRSVAQSAIDVKGLLGALAFGNAVLVFCAAPG